MALSDLRDIDIGDFDSWPRWFRIFGSILICGAILGAGYWFVVKHDIEKLQQVERQELQLKKTYTKQKALAVNLPAYREQMVQIERNFGVMLRQLPNRTEVPELLIEITQAGLARGLQFVLFKPRGKSTGDFYATLPVDLRVVGPYHLLAAFVSDLAAMPRIVNLGNVTINPVGPGSRQLSMSAVIYTYHYLDEAEIEARRRAQAAKARSRRK